MSFLEKLFVMFFDKTRNNYYNKIAELVLEEKILSCKFELVETEEEKQIIEKQISGVYKTKNKLVALRDLHELETYGEIID